MHFNHDFVQQLSLPIQLMMDHICLLFSMLHICLLFTRLFGPLPISTGPHAAITYDNVCIVVCLRRVPQALAHCMYTFVLH